MDRADLKLFFLLAYVVAAALHAALAYAIQTRHPRALEIRVFAAANGMLAVWHLLQLVEYLQVSGMTHLGPRATGWLLGAQLGVGMLVLVLFFHLFATFERVYRRTAPSLRAAITTHVHRRQAIYVPAAYLTVFFGTLAYLLDAGGVGEALASLRGMIGPTSAYLFGGTLLFMVFVLFPARAGQEKIMVPALGRGLLMVSLALVLILTALWQGAHPMRTQLMLLPWLHLHSVAFCVFLALVRYEFSFMDHYVSESLRFLTWATVVGVCYFAFNRIVFTDPDWGRTATSLGRIGVLLVAVGLGPALGETVARFGERVFFARDAELERELQRFATRLANSADLRELIDSAARDIAQAVHSKEVRILVGSSATREAVQGEGDVRLRIPLGPERPPVGWMLLGDRRNLYPYFEGERRFLRLVGELLGGAIAGMRRGARAHGEEVGGETPAQTGEPGAGGAAELRARVGELETQLARRERNGAHPSLDPEWLNEVLEVGDAASERDPAAAVAVLRSLHSIREYLGRDAQRPESLATAMGFVRDLLTLEKLRLRNRLEVDLVYDRELWDQQVPHGLLFPLLENALRHGVGRQLRTGRIEVRAHTVGERVEIAVLDNGGGFPARFDASGDPGTGGLSQVRRSLQAFDPERAELRIDTAALDGADVRVLLPRRVHAGTGTPSSAA